MKLNFIIILICSLIFLSCENPTEPLPLRSPEGKTPIVTGLRITTEKDPTPVDIWGIPNDGDVTGNQAWQYSSQINSKKIEDVGPDLSIPRGSRLRNPYPNPSKNTSSLEFEIPYSSKVSLWVVPANLINKRFANADKYKGNAVIEIFRDKILFAGGYSYSWNGTDSHGKNVLPGLYRIYLKIDNAIAWKDLLLYQDHEYLVNQIEKSLKH